MLFDRKNHKYYKGLVSSRLSSNFIFCFVSNSTGYHGPVTAELAHKHFGAQMGAASGRQVQSYDIVTIALKKGFTDPRTGIRYEEHFLTPYQMKRNFKDLYDYSRTHPDLTFVLAYTLHKQGNPRMGPAHNACGYDSFQLARFFGFCDVWGIPLQRLFKRVKKQRKIDEYTHSKTLLEQTVRDLSCQFVSDHCFHTRTSIDGEMTVCMDCGLILEESEVSSEMDYLSHKVKRR